MIGNEEKYITFSVPFKKELANGKTIAYKIKFIDSFRFSLGVLNVKRIKRKTLIKN